MTKNVKFWIPKNRYFELKFYCLQYFHWKDLVNREGISEEIKERCQKAIYTVERAVQAVNCDYGDLLLKCVTDGVPYTKLAETRKMPSKDEFYESYRKFFYFLSKYRGI